MTTWGQPLPGTEAYAVKLEVERKKKIAREKGLDRLLSDVYHEKGLRNYEAWFKNDRNRRRVHPSVSEIVNGEDQINKDKLPFVEFSMAAHKYRVTSRLWQGEMGTCNDLTLYMNGHRLFEISERKADGGPAGDTYRPFAVNAYVNDDWVEDFRQLEEHYKRISEQASIEFAEDKKRLQETKEAFGIDTTPNMPEGTREGSEVPKPSSATAKSPVKNVAFWVVIVIFVSLAILWATR